MDLDPSPLFRDLETGERPVVAVSGGSDSLALLLLAHDYLSRHRPSARLLAVTVDHGLRPESAAEAERVASLCRALDIAHETVAWRGEKPRTGLAAAAREARYRLLADAAARAGATLVLTGHTLDDQAETLAMRAMRGQGAGREGPGMAGMARATLFDNRVWIARPLLSLRRQALRAWLRGRGVEWIDDPSNENPAYERARVRRQLSARESAVLAARAQERGIARLALARQAAALVARHATRAAPGLLRLERALFGAATQDREAATLALRVALAAAGGASRLPDLARVEALHDRLAQGAPLRATPLRVTPLRATLSRAVVDARKNGVFIRREARDLPAVPLDGATILWDGRWRVTAAAEFAGYDASYKPSDFAGMTHKIRSLLPGGADYDRPSYWAGLRPMTPEGTPIFGTGRHRNLWFNTGHGHIGWTMSCGSARVTRDLIAGRKPDVPLDGMTLNQAA